jgi:hypothetical protein
MKHLAIAAAALFLFAGPGLAQNSSNDCPAYDPNANVNSFSEKCQKEIDAWVSGQNGASITYEGTVEVGSVLPDTVEIIEVPAYRGYGYARLNDRRVLIDRNNRTVVRVF